MPEFRRLRAGALAIASLVAACTAPARVEPAPTAPGAPPADAAVFVAAQRARVANLGDFASRGSAELRWNDAQGDHFEQAQVELAWREAGGRMALRADKLGERLAWAGADPARWWVFEIKSEPSRLLVGARGSVPQGSALPFAGPESVMELMAARPWPDGARFAAAESSGGWWMQWPLAKPVGSWVATRALVAGPGELPLRMELLDATGGAIASSELSNPMTVEVRGVAPGAWPLVAGKTRLRTTAGSATWDVFWDAPGTDPERMKDRLFDLAVLREVLRPQVVEDATEGAAK